MLSDPTIVPPRPEIFFNERFMAARHDEGCYEKNIVTYFACLQRTIKRRRGVGKGSPHFRRYGRELVSKPAISLKKSWGGYRRTTLPNHSTKHTLLSSQLLSCCCCCCCCRCCCRCLLLLLLSSSSLLCGCNLFFVPFNCVSVSADVVVVICISRPTATW